MSSAALLAASPRLAPRPRKRMTRRDPAAGEAARHAFVVASLIALGYARACHRVKYSMPNGSLLFGQRASQENRDSRGVLQVCAATAPYSHTELPLEFCGNFVAIACTNCHK